MGFINWLQDWQLKRRRKQDERIKKGYINLVESIKKTRKKSRKRLKSSKRELRNIQAQIRRDK